MRSDIRSMHKNRPSCAVARLILGMDANEEQELREIFDLVDEDKSGEISVEELQGLMRRLGINPDLVRLFVRH